MAKQVKLSENQAIEVAEMVGAMDDFLNGGCGVFAIAMRRRFGGEVVAFCGAPREGLVGAVDHAAWRAPSGALFDGTGLITEAELVGNRAGRGADWLVRTLSDTHGFEEALLRQTNPPLGVDDVLELIDDALHAARIGL